MVNPLYDQLIAPGAQSDRTFITKISGETISFAELAESAARLATTLEALNVAPGERVAVQVTKSVEALALYVAAMQSGAVFLPLNTAYTPNEVEYFIDNAEPKLLVCDPSREAELAPIATKHGAVVRTLDADGQGSLMTMAMQATAMPGPVDRSPDDLAAILYTSGTTGRSKGAMLTQSNLLSNALVLKDCWQFTESDRLIHALPIFHTHGLFVATNIALAARSQLLFLPSFNVDTIMAFMPSATSMMGVPTFYTRLLEREDLTRETVGHMRLFVSGSAPLLAETHQAFEQRTGHRILERYGMTETNMNTSNPYKGTRKPGTVGTPLPGTELRVVHEETGEPVPDGKTGMIEVRGPNVFPGYWQMPDKTAEEFRADGFFITGDLGRIDADGYVEIVGRAKDLIISGGFNVYPKEVEEAIDQLDGVVESAVFGVPHPDFGEGVMAAVVPAAGGNLTRDGILSGISASLARFKQPKEVAILDALPRNTMGKVQKNILRQRFTGQFARRGDKANV